MKNYITKWKWFALIILLFLSDPNFAGNPNDHFKTTFKVHYIEDSISLTPYSLNLIEKKIKEIPKGHIITHINLVGYTDSVGTKESNRSVALERVKKVKNILIGHNIDIAKIEVSGIGEGKYIANQHTSRGRLLNNRTEIIVHHRPINMVKMDRVRTDELHRAQVEQSGMNTMVKNALLKE